MQNIMAIKGYAAHTWRNVFNRTPAERLDFFRALSQSYASKDWRIARAAISTPKDAALSPGINSKNYGIRTDSYPVMYGFADSAFRGEQWADECEEAGRTVDHQGWFSDADCSRALRAFVFRLSHGRYGCGYADTDSGQRVYLLEVHPNARSAAASADHEAQHYAEEEKEYSERWQAARELRDNNEDSRKEAKRLYKLRNDTECGEECRSELREVLRVIRQRDEELRDNYSDIEE